MSYLGLCLNVKQPNTHLTRLIIWEVVVTEPDTKGSPLELCSHKSIELQSGSKTSALLPLELHLYKITNIISLLQ